MSHNRGMEKQTQNNDVFTKVNESGERGVFLNGKEADEFRAYKRRKKMTEVALAISRSEGTLFGGEDVQRVCERAMRLKQAAIKLPLSRLAQAKGYLVGDFVRLDCVVGGNGETIAKVKAYEARLAVKRGAKEVTVAVTPSLFDNCRYVEIRKELKTMKRAVGKAALKVRVEKISSPTSLSRLARICSEIGAKYLSVPYFVGCERLRLDLTNGCLLETTGVERVETFQNLTAKGVERIVTDHAWEIYNDWMREATETPIADTLRTETSAAEGQSFKAETDAPTQAEQPSAVKMLAVQERTQTSAEERIANEKKEMELKLL